MKTLDEIGVKHGTDKSSWHHHYLQLYELLFSRWRFSPIRILEIGVQFGHSLKTWQEYFVSASIIGIDSVDNGIDLDLDGIQIAIGDAYSREMFDRLYGQEFHIIIDDGSHDPGHQRWFIEHYFELLTDDGILIVEDVLSPDTIGMLAKAFPKDFCYVAVDMTEGNSTVDSRLFIAWHITK